jgi:two-component system nitrate/nitrite response regulator NarL
MIRLLLADDHALFLEGIERLLTAQPDFTVVGAVRTFDDARKILASKEVDILLLDFDFGLDKATPMVREVIGGGFSGKILIVTGGISDVEAMQLIRGGVAGIFHKHKGSAALCEAIRQVARGEHHLDANYVGSVVRSLSEPEKGLPELRDKEVELLRFIFKGMLNKEIADKLNMTESGVKSALRALFNKIGVKTRSQAVRVALEQYRSWL